MSDAHLFCRRCGTEVRPTCHWLLCRNGTMHLEAICSRCERHIKFMPHDSPEATGGVRYPIVESWRTRRQHTQPESTL